MRFHDLHRAIITCENKRNNGSTITMFHGTSRKHLANILKNGLKPGPGLRGGKDAVYLTASFSRASTYATIHENPVIIELIVKHGRSLEYDPDDRPEDLLGVTSDDGGLSKLHDFLKKSGISFKPHWTETIESKGLTAIHGKKISELITSTPNSPIVGKFGHISIQDGGVVQIDSAYISDKAQFRTFSAISPSSITGLWVRKSDFPKLKALDTKKIAKDQLPADEIEDAIAMDGLEIGHEELHANIVALSNKYISNPQANWDRFFDLLKKNQKHLGKAYLSKDKPIIKRLQDIIDIIHPHRYGENARKTNSVIPPTPEESKKIVDAAKWIQERSKDRLRKTRDFTDEDFAEWEDVKWIKIDPKIL